MPWRYTFIKQAMFVEGTGSYVVAFKDRIWLLEPYEETEESLNTIESIEKAFGLSFQDGHELISELRDKRPDVLVGSIDGKDLRLMSGYNWRFGTGSHLLKKVMKELGLQMVHHDNSEGYTYRSHFDVDVTGEIPNLLYHGTTSENALGILRFGLMADRASTNYQGRGKYNTDIYHENTVFLTEDIDKAEHHAFNAVTRDLQYGWGGKAQGRKRGFPVIFQFEIPDPALLIPDYDIDSMSEEHSTGAYQALYDSQGGKPNDYERIEEHPMQFAKQVGVFGYNGRIPASHIRQILVFITEDTDGNMSSEGFDLSNWQKVTPEQLERAIDIGESWGVFDENFEEEEDWCPECGYEQEFCQCNEELDTQSQNLLGIKVARGDNNFDYIDSAETRTETFLVHDIDRYTSDDIAINITMQETKNRWSVGVYSVNYKVGVSGYQEYWHYDKDQKKQAEETYERVLEVVAEIVEKIEYNEIPVTLAKPFIRAQLYKIDPAHKERSGVYFFNWYATDNQPVADWRESIYGVKYPKERHLETMDHNWNEPGRSSEIETTGRGRNKSYQVRYSSQNKKNMDICHIKTSGKGLGFLLGLSPGLVGAFLLWAAHVKNMPAEDIVQQVQENPQQVAPLVQEFQQHAEVPEYEPANLQEPESVKSQEPERDLFREALEFTLGKEGGWVNDPDDTGGETNYGVTLNTYEKFLKKNKLPTDNIDMKKIPMEHVEQIYRQFWDAAGCDNLSPLMSKLVFDFAINSNPNRAVRYLQLTVGVKTDGIFGPKTKAAVDQYIQQHGEEALARAYLQKRRDFIVKSKKIHEKFKNGLLNRISTLEELIEAKSMPIKPNSPKIRAKNPPKQIIRPFDSKQVEIFDEAKPMALEPDAYATEPTPHRLMTHLDFAPSPWSNIKIPQPQDQAKIEEMYAGVHATQSIELAAVYANNRATPDDPGVVIEFATSKQWEPDVDALNHYIDNIHDKVKEIDGLEDAVNRFENTGDIDWQYIEDVFDEIESDDEWPEYEREWTNDVNDLLQQRAERGTLSQLAEFFKTYYHEEDESQQAFDFYVPRYLKGFYEWYLVPLFTGGNAMDARIEAWFLNQMRFMEPIGEDEILAIYKVERYNSEVHDPWSEGEPDDRETDDEGRQLVTLEDVDYWEPSLSTLWQSPNAETVRRKNIPTYYHGTSLSRAKKALSGILDVRAAASELRTMYGKDWGKVAATLKKWGLPKRVIANVNDHFLKTS